MLIEGYRSEEILALAPPEVDAYLFTGKPLVIRAGTAEVLAEFRRVDTTLTVELAQIDGGGEGVLPALSVLACAVARQRGLTEIEWIVHALNCANPNPKLRPFLERRGFQIEDLPGIGTAYRLVQPLPT
jgi:hypothetical protein